MQKLHEWKDFEAFVASLYENDADVKVERNVVELDKTGAKRETDVKVTKRWKFHQIVTLIECKRWKEKVTRARVDILFASMEGLNAQKGVIFTTKGYEAGAEKYAKGKNIDIFVVRELTDEEWGLPGREIHLYNHFWSGEYVNVNPGGTFIPRPGVRGKVEIKLDLVLAPGKVGDASCDLYSVETDKHGPNLQSILQSAHTEILKALSQQAGLQKDGADIAILFEQVPVILDFRHTSFRRLKLKDGLLDLGQVGALFKAKLNQQELKIDRGAKLEMAVVVENYITNAKHLATKQASDQPSELKDLAESERREGTPLRNKQIFAITLSPFVPVDEANIGGRGYLVQIVNLKVQIADEDTFAFEASFVRPTQGHAPHADSMHTSDSSIDE